MKTVLIIFAIVEFLLMFSTTVCGLWLRGQKVVDPSSVTFHMTIALATVLLGAVTIGLAVFRH